MAKMDDISFNDNIGGNFKKTEGIFHKFTDGDNIIRMVGEGLETRMHFIAPHPKNNDRGLCSERAFSYKDVEDKSKVLPKMMMCLDWDIENEKPREEKTCPVCKLYRKSRDMLKKERDKMSQADIDFLTWLVGKTRQNTTYKWNVLDRDNPYVLEVAEDGSKTKVLGYKVAGIGKEAMRDIKGISEQVKKNGNDICGIDDGVDINIKKGRANGRTSYSAQAIMEGLSVKVTPLTDEEKELEPHDLVRIAGRYPDLITLLDSMHEELRDMLDEDGDNETEVPVAPVKTKKPKKQVKPEPKNNAFEEEDEGLFDDEDTDDGEPIQYQCMGDYDANDTECQNCNEKERCKTYEK